MNYLDPWVCAVFLTVAFVLAGLMQTFWLRSQLSERFRIPLDGGNTIRGRRIFGDNKTWRGFVIMIPAVGGVFFLLGGLRPLMPAEWTAGLWNLTTLEFALTGCWVGFGFMIGELPNSFVKRQVGIEPGSLPDNGWAKPIWFTIDQVDSVVGGMLALSFFVPIPFLTWAFILVVGPAMHWSFNLLFFLLGMKARPA